jgi:hypothetical protein
MFKNSNGMIAKNAYICGYEKDSPSSHSIHPDVAACTKPGTV